MQKLENFLMQQQRNPTTVSQMIEETLLAFLDDTHVIIPCPDRTTTVYAALQEAMFSTTGIRINPGKTKIWNAAGVKPSGCGVLQRIAETYDPTAVVWRGSELPTH